MAAESAGSLPSSSSCHPSSSGGGAVDPSNLFSDPPSPLRLSRDQLKHCSEALAFLKNKLRNPVKIRQEFDLLQVFSQIDTAFIPFCPQGFRIPNRSVEIFFRVNQILSTSYWWNVVFLVRDPSVVPEISLNNMQSNNHTLQKLFIVSFFKF